MNETGSTRPEPAKITSYSNPADAYAKWALDPTPDNMAAAVGALDPIINAEIQRFSGPKPLLRSRARGLAVRAIRTYDPKSGARLQSWLTTQMQPLARYGQQLQPLYAPEVAVRQAAQVNRVSKELSDELGHNPSDEELADAIGISVKRIKAVRSMVKPVVAEGAMSGVDGSDEPAGMPGVDSPKSLSTAEEAVYQSLNPRDKMIFDLKTGKHGKTALPNKDIALRLGVTPALISQRTQAMAMQIADIGERGIL